jgi:hypothetical protein
MLTLVSASQRCSCFIYRLTGRVPAPRAVYVHDIPHTALGVAPGERIKTAHQLWTLFAYNYSLVLSLSLPISLFVCAWCVV